MPLHATHPEPFQYGVVEAQHCVVSFNDCDCPVGHCWHVFVVVFQLGVSVGQQFWPLASPIASCWPLGHWHFPAVLSHGFVVGHVTQPFVAVLQLSPLFGQHWSLLFAASNSPVGHSHFNVVGLNCVFGAVHPDEHAFNAVSQFGAVGGQQWPFDKLGLDEAQQPPVTVTSPVAHLHVKVPASHTLVFNNEVSPTTPLAVHVTHFVPSQYIFCAEQHCVELFCAGNWPD